MSAGIRDTMDTHTYSAEADLPADELFEALTERPEVARGLPGIELDESRDGGPRADVGSRALSWGSDADGYRGELRISEQGPDRCRLDMSVTTTRTDGGQVRQELAEALAAITHTATAETDVEGARGQRGWA